MWNILLLVVSMAIQYATRPKPQNAKPAGIKDFKVPTAEDGRPIQVLVGTKWIDSPNWVWYGDLRVTPIRKVVG